MRSLTTTGAVHNIYLYLRLSHGNYLHRDGIHGLLLSLQSTCLFRFVFDIVNSKQMQKWREMVTSVGHSTCRYRFSMFHTKPRYSLTVTSNCRWLQRLEQLSVFPFINCVHQCASVCTRSFTLSGHPSQSAIHQVANDAG